MNYDEGWKDRETGYATKRMEPAPVDTVRQRGPEEKRTSSIRQMKHLKADLLIFIALLLFGSILWAGIPGPTAIDLQLHDTYFVIDKVSLTVWMLGPLTFVIFFIRAWHQKFRSFSANIGLAIGAILIALITYSVISILSL